MPTNFDDKVGILADLWINFRSEEQFSDFIEYNDIGLPLAYFVHTKICSLSEQSKIYIDETFDLLCAALELDLDDEYKTLNEMFDKSDNVE